MKKKKRGDYLTDTAFAGLAAALGGDERRLVRRRWNPGGGACVGLCCASCTRRRPPFPSPTGGGGGMRRLVFISMYSDPQLREREGGREKLDGFNGFLLGWLKHCF